jgi:hypothetical protein
MRRKLFCLMVMAVLSVSFALSQETTMDPYSDPIPSNADVIGVSFVEFATLPDIEGRAARMMTMLDESATSRLFVSDMRGPIYRISYDGKNVATYLDVNAAKWDVSVQSSGGERGVQSFAFHPQFAEAGAPGFGKLYIYVDTSRLHAR